MRSIHKKTLKRFLSTLLALTMVLGMVPLTALAAPAEYVITVDSPAKVAVGQTVDGSATLHGNPGATPHDKALLKIEIKDADSNLAADADVDIIATDTLNGNDVDIADVRQWGPDAGFHVDANYSATTPLKLTFNKAGTYTVTFKLVDREHSDAEICSGTKTITVVGFTSLAASSANPQIGTDFTVTAETTATSGTVQFSYGSQTRTAAVGTTDGKATAAFTAEASQTEVVAILSGISGVDAVTKTTTITLDPADTYYDVTFKSGGSDVYDPPSNTTYTGTYTITTEEPGRDGYTFAAWYDGTNYYKYDRVSGKWQSSTAIDGIYADFTGFSGTNVTLTAQWIKNATYSVTYNKNTTVSVTGMPDSVTGIAAGSSYIISNAEPSRVGYTFKGWALTADGAVVYLPGATITVSADVTLYAVWERNTVSVTLPANGTGYTIASSTLTVDGEKNVTEGSTQTFTVTVTAGYDPATMKVTANGVALSATAVSGNAYTYKFVADVDTVIDVVAPSMLTYTITLPTGEHFTANFTAPSDAVGKGSYTFNYGATDAVFSVQLKDGYTATVYIDGAAQTPEITKNGTATYSLHATDGITHVCDIRVETAKVQTFTVTYTIDGQAYTTRTVDKGTAVNTLSDIDVPSKEGYTFGAWYSDTGLTTALANTADTEKVTADMEVYGKWMPVQGHIAYDLKDGTGSGITTQTKVYGVSLQLHATIPTRTGFTFKGWATVDGGAAVYQPGDMYSTEIGTSTVTLYAVWEQITYTVTLPSGTGYSISTTQSTTVEYGGSFTFTVKVDRNYATAEPTVKANTATLSNGTAGDSGDGGKTYTYTIPNITADQVVSVSVTENKTFTVTFYTWKNDGTTTEVYLTQQVEDTYKATQPANPVIEGYTFGGWYTVVDGSAFALGTGAATKALDAMYNFDNAVKGNLVVVAQMIPITPKVTWTAGGTGWALAVTSATPTGTYTSPYFVTYNTDVTFTVTIADGYDASNMQVGANGVALAPISIAGNVYTYKLTGVKVDTTITVVGVVRKTVKITYSANADDDVSKMPGVQTVNSYVESATDNSKIINIIPSRVGYTFQGWATTPTGAVKYAKAAIEGTPGATSKETADTTLYAIWDADSTSISLAVSDVAVAAGTGTNAKEYEGQPVTLTATIEAAPSTGSVIFYQSSDGTTWTVISSQSANGSDTYTFEATTGAYSGTDTYKVEYKAESAEGYSDSTSGTVSVDRLSTTITWKLNTSNEVDGTSDYHYASTLTITPDGGSALTPGTPMTAGQTYILTAPAVYELGTDYTTALKVGTDYTITWQYLDGANGWKTLAENQTTSDYQVTSQYSKYQFRALMVVNTGDSTVYTKAAKFASEYYGARQAETMSCLISEPTPAVALQQTKTTLAITAPTEGASEWKAINGADVKFYSEHFVQFEGQTVTLTATVVETVTSGTAPAVASGSVEFYQNDTLIATVPVETAGANMGKASFEATMTAFTGTDATTNKDVFTAKYVKNATYDESTSTPSEVYIKSTAIQTPVINSALSGKRGSVTGATSTSYTEDLTGLLAGVEHTFTLRETGAGGVTGQTSDWSVVALDGRTVAPENYTIQWNVKTGDNTETSTTVGGTFTTTDNKVGDEISVTLIAKNDMKVDATSKKAIIGTKQDVTVTVTASDEIASTTTGDPDVYQLNPITLTATVAAKETDATVKPSGTVAFYYQDSTNWVYLGEAVLNVDTDGQMRASITTTELPVTDTTNIKRDVKISVTYTGDKTFNEITDQTDTKITPKTVTVYSSVVYVNSNVENKTVTVSNANKNHNSGIYIFAEEDKVLANETNVNLKLSDVYTLDHDPMLALSKLAHGVDYTVQWQVLGNAAAYSDKTTAEGWEYIDDATGVTCQIDVEDGAAYRAVITVKDTPIAKGSYTFVDQGAVGTADIKDGRQVYYSNILVAADAPATVTVNVNTDNTTDGYEGIVEGETVTIHTFASGASGTTPISELTTTVTKDGASEPIFSETKTNVNGHVSFTWDTAKEGAVAEPGYYTLEVVAKFTNGYDNKTITRTLIVRDDNYSFDVSGNNPVYNGKVQGLTVDVTRMADAFNLAADASVVVYYYTDENRTQQVEPTQAGTYYATIRLQESAYWTEKTEETTLTIKQREVSVVDLVAQAKVYDGTTDANIQEIILNDAETAQSTTGLPTGNTGVINGDSVYAIGTAVTNSANVNEATQVTVTVTLPLLGDDAANYTLVNNTYTEDFTIQRSQVKGDIANSTFQYTGSNITVPADDIILIDQAGNVITPANYTVTYYYHNGDGVEKVTAMNKLGKYTVIARPEQNNYKGGASQTVYVAATADDQDPDTTAKSALIDITNTVELYGAAGNTGIVATATNGATTTVNYNVSGSWTTTVPSDAGRYLVKVTTDTNDTAYGIYTIVKARPEFVPTTNSAEPIYNSARYSGTVAPGFLNGKSDDAAEIYITYTGGTIQGIAYEAPTEVGKYIATVHVGETANYTAHEEQVAFEIKPKALKITADSLQRRQYGAFPDMTASFDGLADSAYAPDTSLRDVQIQPELIFNETDGYDNIAMDHVGNEYPIIAIAALARNYDVSYVNGNLSVTRDEPNPYLAIHGMIDNGNGGDIAYYGDVIQLYAYGSQSKTTGVINNSSVLTWSVTPDSGFSGSVNIDENGLLTINGVGTFTVTLTRGVGAQKISTTLTIDARKQEVKVDVKDQDKVYNGETQTYSGSMTAYDEKFSPVSTTITSGNTTRVDGNIGSQIVTGKVADGVDYYQSETYGGLFTINDKEVTINAVNEPGVVYGAQLQETDLHYTESGTVGTSLVDALTDGYAVSIRNAYVNLDVTSDVTKGYEILVAGRENINYNVKYVTEATDNDVEVVAKTLKLETGVINFDGRTSGYMKENDQYFEDKGFEVTGTTTFNKTPVDRMYGEVNPVMDYLFDSLIAGDSEADLADLLAWLVEYSDVVKHNIQGDANVKFDKDHHLSGYRSSDYLTGMDAYYIDGMLGTAGVKNYTTTVTEATQNIYQRPVTLKLANGADTLDVYIEDAKNDTILLNIIKQNLEVSGYTYGGVEYGGLAEKLGHTIEKLQLAITHKTVDHSGDYIVHVKVGNPNYWLSNTCTDSCAASGSCGHSAETFSVKINVTPDSIKVVYNEPNALGWTSASVVMHKMPEDQPVDLSAGSKVYFAIYEDKGAGYDYSGETKIRSGWMNRASQTGVWTCTYSRLTAGNYRIFAIPVGDYTIINSGNVPVPAYPNP